jgi:hypothetical protein
MHSLLPVRATRPSRLTLLNLIARIPFGWNSSDTSNSSQKLSFESPLVSVGARVFRKILQDP